MLKSLESSVESSVEQAKSVKSVFNNFPSQSDEKISCLVSVSPEEAGEILKLSTKINFRKLSPDKVKALSRSMEKWDLNGETIKFNSEGLLVDGQHRLTACKNSGFTFFTFAVFGVENDLNIDAGSRRRLSDYLKFNGYKNTPRLAAALNRQWLYENDYLWSFRHAGSQKANYDELISILEKDPECWEEAVSLAHKYKIAISLLAFVLYNAIKTDRKLGLEFIEKLASQANLSEDSPLLQLNNRLIDDLKSNLRVQPIHKLILIIKAWNAFALGMKVSKKYFSHNTIRKEDHPEFITKENIDNF